MKRLAATLGALLLALSASAQNYPGKPIKLIVPLAAAGTGDTLARAVGEAMSKELGQPVVIENRPGAGGLVGTELVANAPPDGYTLLAVSPSHVINATLYSKAGYDPVKSFEPITLMAYTHQILVAHPSVPFNDLKGLIDYAKKHPGELNYGSAGTGSATHLNMELFKSMAGVNIVHVPYKGTGPAVTALLSGEVDLYFATVPAALPLVEAKKLRALGVTSARRSPLMRDVPAIAEAGLKGYETSTWHGILAPAATPADIVVKLNAEIARTLAQPAVRERLVGQGLDPVGGTPEQFGAYLKTEISKWAVVVKASGARPE